MRTASPLPTAFAPLAETLDDAHRLVVRQARDWSELVGLEAANQYAVLTEPGAIAGLLLERGGNPLLRWVLKANRPFEMDLLATAGPSAPAGPRTPVLRLRRPFRLWHARLEVRDADGRPMGAVQERYSFLRRRFDVLGADGRLLARLIGPLWRPWTFLVHAAEGERELGRIEKRWSGLVSEAITDADTFLVTLPAGDPVLRRLTLAAAVLIDFKFFEERA